MGNVASQIEEKLKTALSPDYLEVIDESFLHAGHGGARPEGETHFRVIVVAAAFEGRVAAERQRRVMDVLSEELTGRCMRWPFAHAHRMSINPNPALLGPRPD